MKKNIIMSKKVFEHLQKHLEEFCEHQQKFLEDNVPVIPERKKVDELFKLYIKQLEDLLSNAQSVDSNDFKLPFVTIGSEVELENMQNSRSQKVRIMLPKQNSEGSSKFSRASCLSPMGYALFLRKAGETIEVDAPAGICRYRIKSVSLPFR